MADRSRDARAGRARIVVRLLLALVLAASAAGCVERQLVFPETSLFPSIPAKPAHVETEEPPISRGTIEVGPVPRRPTVPAARLQVEPFSLRLGNEPVSGSFDQMPLNAFINA